MFKDKSGSAYIFIYGMYFLVFLGILFIIFNQIKSNEIENITNSFNFTAEDRAEAARFGGLWDLLPYIILFLVIVFFIVHIGMAQGV